MQIGMIGLGRMGGNMVRRLMQHGHSCVVYDRAPEAVDALAKAGATGAVLLEDFVNKLTVPKTVWLMVPSGDATESMVNQLAALLPAGSTLIDGGNSFYQDDVRRAKMLQPKGINYIDVGTSGGVWGEQRGYCLMIGGETAAVKRLEPIFTALAPGRGDIPASPGRENMTSTAEQGFLHCGPSGAGHFVKMVHNGMEYGIMQAYAEGFDILRQVNTKDIPEDRRYDLNLADIAELWRRGSVIGSWLLDLTAMALAKNPTLSQYSGTVQDSGEGRWTINAAIEEAVPAPVLAASLFARFRSREEHSYADKMLSAMRQGFGGHVEIKPGSQPK